MKENTQSKRQKLLFFEVTKQTDILCNEERIQIQQFGSENLHISSLFKCSRHNISCYCRDWGPWRFEQVA